MTHALLALAALLSPSDPALVASVAAAIEAQATPWIVLSDELQERSRAVEIDWKTDRDDVVFNLRRLPDYRALPAPARAAAESVSVPGALTVDWLRAMSGEIGAAGAVIATMDIDSDSYVVLLLDKDDFARARELASRAGERLEDIRVHDPNRFED